MHCVSPRPRLQEGEGFTTGDCFPATTSCSAAILSAGYGAEQAVRLEVDPIAEVEGVGIAVVAAGPEPDKPKPAGGHAAGAHRERPDELPVFRVEGIDLAVQVAEVADQEISAEAAEARRRQGDPPGCGETAAGDRLLYELAVFIENRHRPGAERRTDLVENSGGRIGHVDVAVDLPHVERDEPSWQPRVDKGAASEPQRSK